MSCCSLCSPVHLLHCHYFQEILNKMLGEIMGVFRLWMLVLCKVSHITACFVHCNRARRNCYPWLDIHAKCTTASPVWSFVNIMWKYARTKFSLLWKILCAIPREMSGFRALSISLTRQSTLRKEFTKYTVSTVEDVLEAPSRFLSSTSILSLSKAVCHIHNSTVTLHTFRKSSPLGYLNSHLCDNIHTQKIYSHWALQ